eukprot:CAMPEP_0181039188 /NCGR_PEP_ID=MMETSP1070-20121207/10333_1 /TAXON_ID=265543 /ORGANISM="Minutocellus polymorphus, Strain NH13" /LENGTH=2292 /DNA_ID=CAMNT_0023117017 /DNA_START=13 /DNA_END=6891 /DNA_ORIENTATION=-
MPANLLQPSVALPLITGLTRASASRRPTPCPSASAAAAAAASAVPAASTAISATPSSSKGGGSSQSHHGQPDTTSTAQPVLPVVHVQLTSSQRVVSQALRQHRAATAIVTFLRRSVEVRRTNHGIRGGEHDNHATGKGGDAKRGQSTKWVVGGNDKKRRRTAKTPPPSKKKGADDGGTPSSSSNSDANSGNKDRNDDDSSNGTEDTEREAGTQMKKAAVGTLGIAQRHWAWSSLLAPSLRVRRRATTRLLLDGIVPPSHSSIGAGAGGAGAGAGGADGSSSVTTDRLIATLLDLANQDLLLPTTTSTTSTILVSGSADGDTAHNGRRGYGMDTGGDPSLQLLGLLAHLVTEEPLLRMASERSVLDQVAVVATAGAGGRLLPALSSSSSSSSSALVLSATLPSPSELIESDRSIESFVASGGLRWVSASLLRVVVELTTRTAATSSTATDQGGDEMELLTEAPSSSSSRRPCSGSDETELETLQARLVALVDLLYRIVLYAGLTHCDYWKVASQSAASAASTSAATPAATTPSSPPLSAMVSAASIAMESRQNSTLLDKSRQKRRQDALSKVHDLLWSSYVPALSVTTASGGAAAKLSPLACVVASHELLKTGSSDGGSPYLSGRNRGLDRALACLSRIVDVSSTVSVQLPTAGSISTTTTASASNKRGGSSTAGRSIGGSTADRALGGPRASSLSASRAARRRRLTSRRSNPYAAGAGGSSSAAAQRAYSNSLASSLLGLSSPPGAEADPFAAAGFGSPESSSSAAVARSVSAAMSALDRARARGSEGGALPMELDDIDDSDDDDDGSNHGGDGQQRSQPQHGHGDGDANGDSDDDDNDHRDRDEEDPDAAYDRETDMEGQDGKDDEDDDDEEIPSDNEDIAPARAQPVDMEIDEPFDESLLMVDDDGPAGLHDSEIDAAARAMAAAAVAAGSPATSSRLRITSPGAPRVSAAASAATKKPSAATKAKRKSAYLKTGMSLLVAQHASPHHAQRSAAAVSSSLSPSIVLSPPILTTAAEQSLLKSMCDIVRPQKKPVNLKMFLRRAPTQEEFFRGNLTRNPVSLAHLAKTRSGTSSGAAAGGAGQGSGGNEPTVRDLRDHIAKDLQMSDSAEMLEILVANKIVALDLKLRVVAQVLWKEHVLENATTAPAPGSGGGGALGGLSGLVGRGQHVIHAGGGLAMVFSTSGLGQGNESPTSAARAALAASLPPMVCTYRLIGVDGEATEDQVEFGDLTDPDAPQDATTTDKAAYEASMEKEYGVTRVITKGRGINVLLGAISSDLSEWLRKIRRDNVRGFSGTNASREEFVNKTAHPALILLQHCSKISNNRKLMVKARAPTLLLRMLLDVLNAIDEPGAADTALISQLSGIDPENDDAAQASSSGDDKTSNCPTAAALQGLIELLASDISAEADKIVAQGDTNASKDLFHEMAASSDEPDDEDASTMVLLLSSLRSTSLSPPLRKIIAKLLPFLTYGESRQSKELASQFVKYVDLEQLYGAESFDANAGINPNDRYLMETFVSAATNLPPVAVCDSLRSELISQGFVSTIAKFALKDVPTRPPPWSPALFGKSYFDDSPKGTDFDEAKEKEAFESKWRDYFARNGLATALRILNSLGTNHGPTQSLIANVSSDESTAGGGGRGESISLLKVVHWMESTSDKTSADISLKDLGILSETLLDSLQEGNDDVKTQISALRKATRERKKELAMERRSRALAKMGSSGAGVAAAAASAGINASSFATMAATMAATLSSSTSSNTRGSGGGAGATAASAAAQGSSQSSAKPAWMAEMEAMEEETGLTCAVCQEGSTLQPRELLGLYVYIKKVSIPYDKCGGRGDVDGALLLMSLPGLLPASLRGTEMAKNVFQPAVDAADGLRGTSHGAATVSAAATGSGNANNRPTHYTTTVTAGNAIHCTCHAKARTADRNHPKAPKSEWEGASLRNSRVTCNAILPLVASRSSKVSLIAVEQALAEHQTIVANMLGSRPQSMLWHTLHDVRLLLLRMAHGELLGADSGGGSLASNSSLLFYMLSTADMFAKDAVHDAPETAQHAQNIDSGFLAASEILNASDYSGAGSVAQRLKRSFADAAPMAALCCVLFHNLCDDKDVGTTSAASSEGATKPHPKRRWNAHKEQFLYGLMRCAGRRHACSVATSGCVSSRNTLRRQRSSSFADWDESNENDGPPSSPGSASGTESGTAAAAAASSSSALGKRGAPGLNEYAKSLRPMVVLYAILDQLSADFTLNMDDERIDESSQRLVALIRSCIEAENIQDLIKKANITVDHDMLLKEFLRGIETL